MLHSYEAIYDHGHLTWISDVPDLARARVIVTLMHEATPAKLPEAHIQTLPPNGDRMADLLTEMAEKGIGACFGDPLEWQNAERADRPLPGRAAE
ncbi:MAG: hypothetical protein H7839_17770 [Magnetococcus sp. YQC-5]